MKKKIISLVALCAIFCMLLTACGNIGNNKFNYAYIQLQDGTVVQGKVDSWKDYEDEEQLQVKINGVLYLTNSFNCTLIYDPKR